MLKLKGWRSPTGLSSLLILLSIAGVAVTLAYGATNLISQQEQTQQPIAAQDSIDKIDTSETYD